MTATLLSLFGSNPQVNGGQFQPTSFAGQGAAFTPQSFSALPGLLQNQPLTGAESAILGPDIQNLGLVSGLQSQLLFGQGAQALSGQLSGPEAAISAARRDFSQNTLPTILERAPGFSSSDLQREVTRAGVDLETNIAALREQGQANAISQVPQFAQAFGTNLLDQASQVLGFGTLGREFIREQSQAGDAFRVLTALQSLTGPGLTTLGQGQNKNKSTGVLA